ncbi:MAG TPA: squalene synthase HpnC, partial [Ignavibacteriaceae bacterium]
IAVIYWFARSADDIADEGNIDPENRLAMLDEFESDFEKALNFSGENSNLKFLAQTIIKHNLDPKNFTDLISAFKQDVTKKSYSTFSEILDYCSRSANPVGRILLALFKITDEQAKIYSDKVCTALQLTNFYQDTNIDFEKGRNYYPQDEISMFKITQNMFELKENNPNIKALVKHNIERTQLLFDEGKKLLNYLNGRFKIEIKWTIAGGEKILEKIRKNDYDVFSARPKLSKLDFVFLLVKNIF